LSPLAKAWRSTGVVPAIGRSVAGRHSVHAFTPTHEQNATASRMQIQKK